MWVNILALFQLDWVKEERHLRWDLKKLQKQDFHENVFGCQTKISCLVAFWITQKKSNKKEKMRFFTCRRNIESPALVLPFPPAGSRKRYYPQHHAEEKRSAIHLHGLERAYAQGKPISWAILNFDQRYPYYLIRYILHFIQPDIPLHIIIPLIYRADLWFTLA